MAEPGKRHSGLRAMRARGGRARAGVELPDEGLWEDRRPGGAPISVPEVEEGLVTVLSPGVEAPAAPGPLRPLPSGIRRGLEGRTWIHVRFACDLLMLSLATLGAVALGPVPGHLTIFILLYPPLTMMLLSARGRYRRRLREVVLDSVAPGFGAISIAAMTIFMLALLAGADRADLSLLIAHIWVVSLALVTTGGLTLAFVHYAARKRRLIFKPTLIVGPDEGTIAFARRLQRHPEYGLQVVGFLAEPPVELPEGSPPVLGGVDDLAGVVEQWDVSHVIVGYPEISRPELLELTERCDAFGLETTVVPRLVSAITRHTQLEYVGSVPLLNLREVDLESWQFAAKHVIDRVAAALALIAIGPLMLVIALAVRLSSPGPILFSQPRTGRDGVVFPLLKFRTMRAGEEEAFAPEEGMAPGGVEGVDRRTRVGCFLRRTSLDELPQLINVLRGEMSLVGPRPERPEYAELFRHEVDRYNERHRVRAGITGWAQVHGLRGQTPLRDRVELDNFYIEHWSLALDMRILLLTIPALIKGS
jgi:exopolysaccharide biosynthesis polyprenyl glycosylphosphotransferase